MRYQANEAARQAYWYKNSAFAVLAYLGWALALPGISSAQPRPDGRYIAMSAKYEPNGIMSRMGTADVFDSATECGRFISGAILQQQRASGGRLILVGDSVLIADDASGYIWDGCVPFQQHRDGLDEKYLDVKMTPEKARTMKRFPDLSNIRLPPPPTTVIWRGNEYSKAEMLKTIYALAGQTNPDARSQLAEILAIPQARQWATEAGISAEGR